MNDNSKVHVNDVIKTMLERSSIRAYTDEKLTQEQISLLQNAALSAPTAMNAQDQRFVFVTNAEIIAELEAGVVEAACAGGDAAFAERIKQRGGKIMYDAPLFVGIFAHPAKFSGVDAGIAVQNIALAAKSIGLDSVILGLPRLAFEGPNAAKYKKLLGIEVEREFMIGISVGHAAAKPRMSGIAVILLISGKHVQAERESFNIYPVLSCFIPAVRTMPKTANGTIKKFGGSFGRFTPKRKK